MSIGRRLLFLIADEFPTHRPDVATLFGVEMPRHGLAVDLVAQWRRDGQCEGAQWPAGQAFVCGRSGSRAKDQVAAFRHDVRCLWTARAHDYDAIQVRDKVFAGLFGRLRARQLGLPFFYWMSFPMSEGFIQVARQQGRSLGWIRWAFMSIKGHLGRYLIYRWLLPQADHVFVQSDRMADDLVDRGLLRERMTVVPMGADLRELQALPGRSPVVPDSSIGRPLIAYLGALDRARGLDFLLEVLVAVRQRLPSAAMIFVGDATEAQDRAWLEGRANELGLQEAIVWTGWVSRTEAWSHLRQADVAVSLVPRGELFDCSSPTKVVEYLALGLPVVANDLPDQHKVLTESGAGLSVATNVADFSDAIIRILENPIMSAAMRAAGPGYVERHRSYAVLGERLAQVYQRLLADEVGTRSNGALSGVSR